MPGDATFLIELNPSGDGGAFRIKDGKGEITRDHILDRGDSLIVQADMVDQIHGRLTPNGDLASIIVTDFYFIPAKKARRFEAATIIYRFMGEGPDDTGPDVIDISPKGHFTMHQTSKHVESGRSGQIGVQGPAAPVTPSATFAMDLTQSYDTKDHITLAGVMRMEARESGGKDAARWVMIENSTQRSGIPSELRVAILLRRKLEEADKKFFATVEIKVDVDWKSSLEGLPKKLFGRIPKDAPVKFDPKLYAIDREDLGKEVLSKLSAVKVTKVLSDEEVSGAPNASS
jgi:hypothetical protein